MKKLLSIILILALAGAGYAAWTYTAQDNSQAETVASSSVGGPFTLVNHEGLAVTDKDYMGRPFLVYFGFTSCPDVCPTALTSVAQTLDRMGEEARDIQVLFITVDPEYDTPDVMKNYVQALHPNFVGLTGTSGQVKQAVMAYKIHVSPAPIQPHEKHHSHSAPRRINHSDIVFLMKSDGQFFDLLPGSSSLDDMVKGFKNLMKASQ